MVVAYFLYLSNTDGKGNWLLAICEIFTFVVGLHYGRMRYM